jgi:hypothetical protein
MNGGQEIEFQEIETGDQNYCKISGDQNYHFANDFSKMIRRSKRP